MEPQLPVLPEQSAEIRVRTKPAAVYLRWLGPAGAVGREASYVADRHAGRVRVKPAGQYGAKAWTTVEPTDPKAQELAKRWWALVSSFTGGDPGIYRSLRNMYQSEPTVMGMDTAAMRPRMDWILKAAAAAGIKVPS